MNKKKMLLNKFTSLFLALLMLFQIPLNSINIYATNESELSTETSEIISSTDLFSESSSENIIESLSELISEETLNSSLENSSESSSENLSESSLENSSEEKDLSESTSEEITNSSDTNNTETTDSSSTTGSSESTNAISDESTSDTSETSSSEELESELYSGFELKLYGFASNIDAGNTTTNNIHFDVTSTNFTGQFKLQVNYTNKSVDRTYAPGELQIKVEDPTKYMFSRYNPYCYQDFRISADPKDSETKQYAFSYEYIKPTYNTETRCFEGGYLLFTNNNTIEAEQAVAGSFQITFNIDEEDVINTEGYDIKAVMGEIESNPVNVSFSVPETIYTLNTSSPSKITGYGGLGENAENYIWVKLYLYSSKTNIRNVKENESIIKIPVEDENIVIITSNPSYPATKEGNTYYLNGYQYGQMSYNSNPYPQPYVFIGYPKDTYQGQTVSQTFELYGTYNDMHIPYHTDPIYNTLQYDYSNPEKISECTKTFDLSQFEYDGSGDCYINTYFYSPKFSYNRFTTNGAFGYTESRIDVRTSYNNESYNVRFGIDQILINDESGTRTIPEHNYNLVNSYLYLSTLYSDNGQLLTKNKYTCKLYLKTENQDYQLVDTFIYSGSKYFYPSNYGYTTVTGYYFEIEGLEEALNYNSYTCQSYLKIYNMENISETGKILTSSFLDVYKYNENNEEITINVVDESSYKNELSKNILMEHDLNFWGHYVQRSTRTDDYVEEKAKTSIEITQGSETIDNINKYITKTQTVKTGISGHSTTLTYFNGYDFYILIPENTILISSAKEIKANILTKISSNSYMKKFYEEINENLNITLIQNWNNTGRTMININIDCTNNPLMIGDDTASNSYFSNFYFTITYNLKIPFNAISEKNSFTTEAYNFYLNSVEHPANIASYSSQYGKLYPDKDDINSNGDIAENLISHSSTYIVTTAFETYQDAQMQIDTDRSNFTAGLVTANPDSEYTYKLITRTGLNAVTGLRLYNNLEMAYGENEYWQGEFLGIDTSYAKNKGYVVKPYYSENSTAGSLYDENGILNPDWKEYQIGQPEINANGLAIAFNEQFKTEEDWDYVEIYYELDGTTYKLGRWGGTDLAGQTINVPSADFYLYWHTDSSSCSYYGFSIDSISPIEMEIPTNHTQDSLPSYTIEETATYPTSAFDPEHTYGDYKNNVNKLWHYTYPDDMYQEYIESTNPSLVKSLAFEFLDSEGNPAIIPLNTYLYVLINMKAPNEVLDTYAYNNCKTEWTVLDDLGIPVEGISGVESNTTQVKTNIYFKLTVDKIWNDDDNNRGLRPDTVDVILYKDTEEVERKQITTDNLSVTFENLLIDDAASYSVGEAFQQYYTSDIVFNNETGHYEITNIFNEKSILNFSGTKTWLNDTEDLRPDSIAIKLLQDNVEVATTTATVSDNWQYTFDGTYPKYRTDGTEYNYTVEETPVDGYFTFYKPTYNGLQITFSADSQTYDSSDYVRIYYKYNNNFYYLTYSGTSLSGKVVEIPSTDFYMLWHTSSTKRDNYGFSIDSIINKEVKTTPNNGSTANIPNYYINEVKGTTYPESEHYPYETNSDKLWHYTFTSCDVTNEWNKITISGTKTWVDEGESFRPESITIRLLQDGTEITSTTSSAADNWKYSFTDVPKYKADGTKFIYSITEDPVEGYMTFYSNNGSYNITNEQKYITVSGTKTWIDDVTDLRPESITVKLLQDGVEIASTTTSAEQDWKYSFTNVVRHKEDKTKYVYTVEEVPVENYFATYSTGNDGSLNITNTKTIYSRQFTKQDFFTKEIMANVNFKLYKLTDPDNTHKHDDVGENACWTLVEELTTNENGILTLSNMILDDVTKNSIYGLIETTPEGYILPNNLYWKVIIGTDATVSFETTCNMVDLNTFTNTYGWTGYTPDIQSVGNNLVLFNMPTLRSVSVTKQIKVTDINYVHGNPTFIFKLTGTDANNIERTYYQKVEFTPEYVDANTNENGYTSISTTFENLVKCNYVLSEEEVSRYITSEIKETENGTISNSTVAIDLINNTSASATFINEKYENQWFSHNETNPITKESDTPSDVGTISGFTINNKTHVIKQINESLYKINNGYMSPADWTTTHITMTYNGETVTIPASELGPIEVEEGVYIFENFSGVINVTKSITIDGITLEPGIYITIDPAELPDGMNYVIGNPYEDSEKILGFIYEKYSTPILENFDGLYKINNGYMLPEDMINAPWTMTISGETEEGSQTETVSGNIVRVEEVEEGVYVAYTSDSEDDTLPLFISVTKDIIEEDVVLTKGIYTIVPYFFEIISEGKISLDYLCVGYPEELTIKGFILDSTTPIYQEFDGTYKISNKYMSYQDLANATITEYYNGESFSVPVSEIGITTLVDGVYVVGDIFAIVTKTVQLEDMTLTPGIYTPINPNEIPEGAAIIVGNPFEKIYGFIIEETTSVLQSTQLDETDLYKINHGYMTYEDMLSANLTLIYNGETLGTVPITELGIEQLSDGAYVVGDGMLIITKMLNDIPLLPGIYITTNPSDLVGIKVIIGDPYKKDNEEYSIDFTITPTTPVLDEYEGAYKISNTPITLEQWQTATITITTVNGEQLIVPASEIGEIVQSETIVLVGDLFTSVLFSSEDPSTGTWSSIDPTTLSEDGISSIKIEFSLPIEEIELTTSTSILKVMPKLEESTHIVTGVDLYKIDNNYFPIELTEFATFTITTTDGTTETDEAAQYIFPLDENNNIYVLAEAFVVITKPMIIDDIVYSAGIYTAIPPSQLRELGITSIKITISSDITYINVASPSLEEKVPFPISETMSLTYIKVSDRVFTANELIGKTLCAYDNAGNLLESIELTEENVTDNGNIINFLEFFASTTGVSENGITLSAGTWTIFEYCAMLTQEGIASIIIN